MDYLKLPAPAKAAGPMTPPALWKRRSFLPAWRPPAWLPLPATPSPITSLSPGRHSKAVGAATRSMGMNGFTREAPVFLVISGSRL